MQQVSRQLFGICKPLDRQGPAPAKYQFSERMPQGFMRHAVGMIMKCACLVVGLALACAGQTPPPSLPADPPPPEQAAAFYPLSEGWKWAYDIDQGGQQILATYAVIRVIGGVSIIAAGEDRIGYQSLPEGIGKKEGRGDGDLVLKNPVRVGTRWAVTGGEAGVVKTAQVVVTPAGRFAGCAVVEEIRTDPERVVRTTFAPGTGPVLVEELVQDPATGQFRSQMRASLRGVTRPGQDPLAL